MLKMPLAATALFCLTLPVHADSLVVDGVAVPPTSTPEQIQAFKNADNNKDGALTPPEFRAFIETMADQGEPTARFITTFGAHSMAFSKVDRDGDGFARPFEISNANSDFEDNRSDSVIGGAGNR